MRISALYLSVKRLREIVGRPDSHEGSECITDVSTVDLERVRTVNFWEQQTVRWLKAAVVPALEDALAKKELTEGTFFTHLGNFVASGIIAASARFDQSKELKKNPLLYVKLDGISPGARLEMMIHPENLPFASCAGELSSRRRLFAIGRITDARLPNLAAQPYIIGYLYEEPETSGIFARLNHLPTGSSVNGKVDIFLSHASEDKETIARPLYNALRREGLTVWFDEAELKIGDRLRHKIDEGLLRCEFGVVIISPSFLGKDWPQSELDGLLAREVATGSAKILPIWHGLDRADLVQHSPVLVGRMAGKSSQGIPALVQQILKVVRPQHEALPSKMSSVPFTGTKLPILERSDVGVVGIGNSRLQSPGFQNTQGLAFFVRNAERRFPTNALNLRADLTLRYIDGDVIHVENAPWFKDTSAASSGAVFFETVNIGMLEKAGVVYAVARQQTFYVAIHSEAEAVEVGREIPYGDWEMILVIRGDNYLTSFEGKVSFLPDGSNSFTPSD